MMIIKVNDIVDIIESKYHDNVRRQIIWIF